VAQLIDHRDLLEDYSPGDPRASERIVRAYQNELLRSAFLLSGTADGAIRLARDAFLALFRDLMRGGVQDDPRLALLHHLGRRFLEGEPADDNGKGDGESRLPGAPAGLVSIAGEPQRYRVDDERSRVLQALELFESSTRLGLVLREFNALEEEPVCRVIEETPFELRDRLQPARVRLRDATSSGGDQSVRELLITAATSAPRPNLWPEVAGPLEALYAEEEERRQRYTYAAAALVGFLLLLALLWLLDLLPFASGDGNSNAAANPTAGPTATATVTPEPSVTPTPIPDLSSFNIPQGDVPARILMRLTGIRDGQEVAEVGFYDPATGAFTPHALGWFGIPSPDGRFLVGILAPQTESDGSTSTLFASDVSSGERLWTVELPAAIYSYAVTLDHVYVATAVRTGELFDTASLLAFDLATGSSAGDWPDLLPRLRAGDTATTFISLHASPDGERLFVALDEPVNGPVTVWARTLASYGLPEMTFESSSVQTISTGMGQFASSLSSFVAHATPDGGFLYEVGDDAVRLRSAQRDQDIELALPFVPLAARNRQSDLRWITSNDGRYLYILALERRQAAIVDLLARTVTRSFAIDLSSVGEAFGQGTVRSLGTGLGSGLALSPDGRLLYVVGGVSQPSGVGSTSVWIIDLATWSVNAGLEVPGNIDHIAHLNGALLVHTSLAVTNSAQEFQNRILTFDPTTGAQLEEWSNAGLPEWSRSSQVISLPQSYHDVYGRAPAVDGVAPDGIEIESTLPWVEIGGVGESVPAGTMITIGVEARHPSTGEPLATAQPDVRFDPDATAVVRLSPDEGTTEDVILVTNRTGEARYQASAIVHATGHWSAEITFTNADGSTWSFDVPGLFEVTPSLEATDGKRYIVRVRADPSEPPVNEPVAIRAEFVAVEDGEALPEGVGLRGGLPDTLRIIFDSSGRGTTSAALTLNDEGVYEGEASFWVAGIWTATAEIGSDAGPLRVDAGSVTVKSD
jgi:hypothetical protein